ncbi:MAG TPA: cation:proton antiporter [Candidatus Aquilonibacter sp.]|nr:cation:proton antiporter [Candidatus Aquilonibacter sp.]
MPKPLSEHDLLVFLIALPLFVLFARLCGDTAVRFRQPQVLGEVVAGVIIGPTVLGALVHPALASIGPAVKAVEPLSWIGIILLLALTGMESNFASLRNEAVPALLATLGGVVIPLGAGFGYAMLLPASLVGSNGSRIAFAAFVALSMSISAVSVIAKVLADLGQTRRTAAKIILAGGVFDETLGWLLLALISGIASASLRPGGISGSAQTVPVLLVVLKTVAFLGASFLFGRRFVSWILRIVRTYAMIDVPVFTVTVVLALLFAAITQALGLHQILGAFVFGVIAGTVPRIDRETIERIAVVTRGFLAPLFFLLAGVRADFTQLAHPGILPVAAGFIAIAVGGKLIGCTIGGLLGRMSWRESLLIGAGMNVRGSMEIVVAVLGLNLGILSPAIFSVIVLLSVVTILIVPSVIRAAFAAVPPSADERDRLEREEQDERSYTPGVRRVLVPMLPRAQSESGAEFARALARSKAHAEQPLDVVILDFEGATERAPRDAEQRLRDEAARSESPQPVDVEQATVSNERPDDSILSAAERGGFELIVFGAAPPRGNDGRLFGVTIDRVIRDAPCDVLVLSSAVTFDAAHARTIVVPFTGRESARDAGDLALTIASSLNVTVRAISIVPDVHDQSAAVYEQMMRRERSATTALREIEERAQQLGVRFESSVRRASLPAREILRELREPNVGLCVMGANEQSMRGAPFLGDTADLVLRHAATPVALLVPRR